MRVLTLGTFDQFHHGHKRLLDRAAGFGELTVGVNSDRFVLEYKKHKAVENETIRLGSVASHPGVAETLINDGPGIEVIRDLRPDLLVIGSDWLERDYLGQIGTTHVEIMRLRVGILFLPRTPGVSSAELRAAA